MRRPNAGTQVLSRRRTADLACERARGLRSAAILSAKTGWQAARAARVQRRILSDYVKLISMARDPRGPIRHISAAGGDPSVLTRESPSARKNRLPGEDKDCRLSLAGATFAPALHGAPAQPAIEDPQRLENVPRPNVTAREPSLFGTSGSSGRWRERCK